ncbi:pyrroline-5-carboxylate reductase [Bacillus songklensis]|uniref:Pyrroline-5-carboxylate reductase n=1 Tax=Bacillus songklensis TaxID=1069116 RepID=A0ABV8AW50_9BACI
MKKQRVLFIGAGRMAEAIVAGLLETNKSKIEEIIVSNQRDEQRLKRLKQKYGVTTTHDWRFEVANSDVIVLAAPPAAHQNILGELSGFLTGQFVVTIAAGIGPSFLEEHLPLHTPVAWIMPNTAAAIGQSISLYAMGSFATEEHKKVLHMLLKGMGESQQCTEEEIHHLTAITGSAPAFFYQFAEHLIESTKGYGMEEKAARDLVIQMLYGSALMLKKEKEPAMLREQVTTPGGATAEGLKVFAEHRFGDIVQKAIEATNRKALGK